MIDLERIADVFVANKKKFARKNSLDMSMFPKEKVSEIYIKAAERTFQEKDFDSTRHYLFLGRIGDKLLEWGVLLYQSKVEKERKAGKNFLETLVYFDKIPKDIAIELAEDIISEKHPDYSRAALALYRGGALTKAEELSKKLLNEGIHEGGVKFLATAGKRLSNKERRKYSEIALEKERPEDAFKFYEGRKLSLSKRRAKDIINGTKKEWLFDDVIKHMDKNKNPFIAQDFKMFGDNFFNKEKYSKALEVYERARDTIQPEEYKTKGEQILSQSKKIESERTSYSPDESMPSVKIAFDYLSKHNVKEAKRRIVQYADNLLEKEDFAKVGPNFSQFGKLYEMIGMKIPADKALIAAKMAEEKKEYHEAARYYFDAGRKNDVRRMGNFSLKSNDAWKRIRGAEECFELLKNKEDLAIIKFLDKNKVDY